MSKYDKLVEEILQGKSDKNISFEDLCHLLQRLGFAERITEGAIIFSGNRAWKKSLIFSETEAKRSLTKSDR